MQRTNSLYTTCIQVYLAERIFLIFNLFLLIRSNIQSVRWWLLCARLDGTGSTGEKSKNIILTVFRIIWTFPRVGHWSTLSDKARKHLVMDTNAWRFNSCSTPVQILAFTNLSALVILSSWLIILLSVPISFLYQPCSFLFSSLIELIAVVNWCAAVHISFQTDVHSSMPGHHTHTLSTTYKLKHHLVFFYILLTCLEIIHLIHKSKAVTWNWNCGKLAQIFLHWSLHWFIYFSPCAAAHEISPPLSI